MKRSIILPALVTAFVALSPAGVALADNVHTVTGTTGQPNQSAEDQPNEPHGFTTIGFANAADHYAGSENTPSAANAHSPHAVSQYDVAAFQVSNKGPASK